MIEESGQYKLPCSRCGKNPPICGRDGDSMCGQCYASYVVAMKKPNGQANGKTKAPVPRVTSDYLNKNSAVALAKGRRSKPRPINEENWGGYCKGGCGEYITGQFVCNNCKAKIAEKNFALKPGEMELYRGVVGKPKDKVTEQVVILDAMSFEPGKRRGFGQTRYQTAPSHGYSGSRTTERA